MADETPDTPVIPQGPQEPPAKNMPRVGDLRTGVKTGTWRWNGQKWENLPRTFLGTEDFTGRMKAFAKPVLGTMASDLNPITAIPATLKAAVYPETHPGDMLEAGKALFDPATYRGLLEEAKGINPGNPETVGHVLAALAGPKVYDSALSGVNKAAHAVAESGVARSGVGYGAGYLGGKLAGQSPFAGAILGRVLSPLLKGPAGEVANATDKVLNYLHPDRLETSARDRELAGTIGNRPPTPTPQTVLPNKPDIVDSMLAERTAGVPPELRAKYGDMISKFGKGVADRWLERAKTQAAQPGVGQPMTDAEYAARAGYQRGQRPPGASGGSGGGSGSPPPSGAPTGAPPPAEPSPNGSGSQQGGGFSGMGAGGSVDSSNRATQDALNKKVAELRTEFGMDRAGPALRPDLPKEHAVGEGLRQAPGPSWMPDVGQRAFLRDITANKTGNFFKTKQALDQLLDEYERNGGPRPGSEVAQQVFQQLQKMGFIKGGGQP